jgi:hypothetical protein
MMMTEKERDIMVLGRDVKGRADGGDGMDPVAATAWWRTGWWRH